MSGAGSGLSPYSSLLLLKSNRRASIRATKFARAHSNEIKSNAASIRGPPSLLALRSAMSHLEGVSASALPPPRAQLARSLSPPHGLE